MQQKRPVAYYSQGLKGRLLHLSTYEKELYALVQVYGSGDHMFLDKNS